MVERSYSNVELVEIIRNALALAPRQDGLENGEAADRMLAEGVDLDTAYAALRRHLHHSRAQSRPPRAASPWERDPQWWEHSQLVNRRELARVKADALAILRAALTPTGPFIITIPALSGRYHIRPRDYHFGTQIKSGIEIVTDNGIRPGRNVIMLLRPAPVSQELINELDQEACATLTATGKSLLKKARAGLIQPALAAKGYHLAEGTIENRLKAKRS